MGGEGRPGAHLPLQIFCTLALLWRLRSVLLWLPHATHQLSVSTSASLSGPKGEGVGAAADLSLLRPDLALGLAGRT